MNIQRWWSAKPCSVRESHVSKTHRSILFRYDPTSKKPVTLLKGLQRFWRNEGKPDAGENNARMHIIQVLIFKSGDCPMKWEDCQGFENSPNEDYILLEARAFERNIINIVAIVSLSPSIYVHEQNIPIPCLVYTAYGSSAVRFCLRNYLLSAWFWWFLEGTYLNKVLLPAFQSFSLALFLFHNIGHAHMPICVVVMTRNLLATLWISNTCWPTAPRLKDRRTPALALWQHSICVDENATTRSILIIASIYVERQPHDLRWASPGAQNFAFPSLAQFGVI